MGETFVINCRTDDFSVSKQGQKSTCLLVLRNSKINTSTCSGLAVLRTFIPYSSFVDFYSDRCY